MRVPALCLSILLVLATSALASDGLIEIDHARALAGGVSPGDGAGYPITLSASGSYRLTGNLDVPGGVAIQITAANVTVDLNGFTISCSDPTACGASGPVIPSTGIFATPVTTQQGSTVRNGMVRGFRRGIWLSRYSRVEGVTVTNNLDIGILMHVGGLVRNCTVTSNGEGIDTAGGTRIVGNVVDDNLVAALCATSGVMSAYQDNVISGNASTFCPNSLLFDAGGNLCNAGACP